MLSAAPVSECHDAMQSWAGHEACADFHVSLPAASLKRGLPVPPLMLEPVAQDFGSLLMPLS